MTSSSNLILYICLLFFFLLIGCGASDPNRTFYVPPKDLDTLSIYDVNDPPTLDPAQSWGFFDGRLVGLIFSNLVRFDREANIIPDLAESWTISEDGRHYDFQLNPEATFSNGRKVIASDVKYSFERVLDPKTASRSRWILEKVQSVDVLSDTSVRVSLAEPFTPFIGMLAMPSAAIVPREEVERCEREGIPFGEHPLGSGPWLFREWQHDQYILLDRREDYWGQKPKSKHINYRIIGNAFTAVAEFETGNMAAIDPLPEVEILRLKTHPQWKNYVSLAQMLTLDMILFNTEKPGFSDPEVRRALCKLMELPLVLDVTREGAGIVANGPIPKGISGYDETLKPYPYDPESALPVLKKSGLLDRQLSFLLPSSGDDFIRTLGEVVQAEWKKLGLDIRLQQLEWATYRREMLDGHFDIVFRNWYADYPDGDNFLYPLFHSSQIDLVNVSRLNHPELDALIERSQREQNVEARLKMLKEADRMVHDLAPAIFLWYRGKYVVKQPWLKGYSIPLIFNGTRYLTEEIVPVEG